MFATSTTSFHFLNTTIHYHVILSLLIIFTLSPSLVHTLSFNISGFEASNTANNMIYQGCASTYNGSIELNTVDNPAQVGHAIYGEPLHLWDSSKGSLTLTNFTTKFTFTIYPLDNTSLGDGFAFYLAPIGFQIPPNSAGEYLGLFNVTTMNGLPQNQMISIEFDTFVNDFDPNMTHVGINNNSIKSLVTSRFGIDPNNIGKTCHALINYSATNQTLSVFWSFDDDGINNNNESSISSGFLSNINYSSLSYKINLTETLPEWVTVGFSAATGNFLERHVIHSWEFISTLNSTDSKVIRKTHKKKKVVIVTTVPSFVFLVLVAMIVSMNKRRKNNHVTNNNIFTHTLEANDPYKSSIPRRFDYKELVTATNGFSYENKLGRGGS